MPGLNKDFYIIGHRGAAGEKLENSLEGFEHALTLGIDAVELDIREHSSELWVFHDSDLERLTGTPGLFEDQTDLAAIYLSNGEAIPTLKQVLDLYWGKMPLNIEIKSITNLELLLQLLDQYPELETPRGLPWILISSFDHDIIQNLDQLNTPWPLAPITDLYHHQAAADFEPTTPYSWHFDDQCLDFKAVQELYSKGIPSLVFTVNDSARAIQLKQHGIAGIFTDFPSKMAQID
ncbi:MAG: glycerophosphodiester phosphodiesterase [Gammaproteobacteria bacterium]|nr:glycerophosphodiester phosphodiesterase [Gammaproteobacteria bacterium]